MSAVDVSPLYLWPLADVIELLPIDVADSPQARRLAVLIGEAQAAGRALDVLGWLVDAGRLLNCYEGSVVLMRAIVAAEEVVVRHGAEVPADVLEALKELDYMRDPENVPSMIVDFARAFAESDGMDGGAAWYMATETLHELARAAGHVGEADAAITKATEAAYRRLFAAR